MIGGNNMKFLQRLFPKEKKEHAWPAGYLYNPSSYKLLPHAETPANANLDGPFYVTTQCILCGLPSETAPKNIGYHPDCDSPSNCRLFKQPENLSELTLVLEAMAHSCVEGIRYRGTDSVILDRLRELNMAHLADSLQTEIKPVRPE
jgi:hypothetical protein